MCGDDPLYVRFRAPGGKYLNRSLRHLSGTKLILCSDSVRLHTGYIFTGAVPNPSNSKIFIPPRKLHEDGDRSNDQEVEDHELVHFLPDMSLPALQNTDGISVCVCV